MKRSKAGIGRRLDWVLRTVGQLWLWLGLSLLVVLLIDQGLRAVLPDVHEPSWVPGARAPERSAAAAQADPDFARAYAREHAASRHTRWRPYVYWRRQPFQGRWINIDAHGFRRTWHDGSPVQRRVWLFGGSVLWGSGVADGDTIASVLAQRLDAEAEFPGTRVYNFGESGYVAMQSLLAFQRALGCGAPEPDVVVFLDGANDVYAAFQSGVAGWPQNESNRQVEFNLSRRADRVFLAWAARLEGIRRLGAMLAAPPEHPAPTVLGQSVVQHYLEVVAQARSIAVARGITVIHAWQPTLLTRAQPVDDEVAILGATPARLVHLQRSADAALGARAEAERILDLSRLYDRSPEPIYSDFVHPNRAGLAAIAAALLEPVRAALRQRPPRPASTSGGCPERPLE